jgi:hypothetical protein
MNRDLLHREIYQFCLLQSRRKGFILKRKRGRQHVSTVKPAARILEFPFLDGFFNGIGNKPVIPFIIEGLFSSHYRL